MYLAKFFHRAPGDDDRELMLVPGSDPMVIGIHMNWKGEPDANEFLREEFPDIAGAAAAFRRHVAKLVAAGYVETDHTELHAARPRSQSASQAGLAEGAR